MQLFNPLTIEKQTTPEGHQGADVMVFIPFVGYWSPSGKQLTFLSGEIPQRRSSIYLGQTKPNTFRKDASSCVGVPPLL